MKKVKTNFTPKLLVSAISVIIAGTSGYANALDAKISGQLNKAVMTMDDGDKTTAAIVDVVNSSTRFRFTGSQEIDPGLTAGIIWETEYRDTPSSQVGVSDRNHGDSPTMHERHANIFLKGDWGKFSIGQGNGAANGASEVDLSGTTVASYAEQEDVGGAIKFVDKTTRMPTVSIDKTKSSFDFESRHNRARYDSPKLGPVTLAVSAGTKSNNDVFSASASASQKIEGMKVAGTLGYSALAQGGATGTRVRTGGSFSVLSDEGYNFTLSYVKQTDGAVNGNDPSNYYTKVGYITGKHAISATYSDTSDLLNKGDSSTAYGAQYVYKPVGWAELYAAVKVHSLDSKAVGLTNVNDVIVGLFGSRIKF